MASFSRDLARLTEQRGQILAEASNGIWEPSISTFMESPFRVGTDAMPVAVLDSKVDAPPIDHRANVSRESLKIASQSSSDSSEEVVIRVWLCSYVVKCR
jgi:hypothetical protein